jgi:D-serine deaminase-like pyridoxal phosphate-dependent protein
LLPVGRAGNAAKLAASEQLLAEAISGTGKVNAIAGAGTAAVLRDAPRLAAQYGGAMGDWAKMVGRTIKVEGHTLQIHWYENLVTGLKTEFKHNLP